MTKQRIIGGISGATGFAYSVKKVLELVRDPGLKTHQKVSNAAKLTREHETE